MAFWIIIIILLTGLALVFLEVFFIPGTTLFGVAGGVALVAGVMMMYGYYGNGYGHITLGIVVVAVFISIAMGFRVIDSNRLAMKAEIKGKMNELEPQLFNVGDNGVAVTELRPAGKAQFGSNKTEVFSNGEYIQKDSPLEIIKITRDKVFVKSIKS